MKRLFYRGRATGEQPSIAVDNRDGDGGLMVRVAANASVSCMALDRDEIIDLRNTLTRHIEDTDVVSVPRSDLKLVVRQAGSVNYIDDVNQKAYERVENIVLDRNELLGRPPYPSQ